MSMLFISIDRYLSISRPLYHLRVAYQSKILAIIVITWVIMLLIVLLCVFLGGKWNKDVLNCSWGDVLLLGVFYGVLFSIYTIAAITSAVLYIRMVSIAQNRSRVICTTSNFKAVTHRKQKKVNYMIGVVMISYHALYLPAAVLEAFNDSHNFVLFIFYYIFRIAWFSKAMINPVLYGWLSKDFHRAFQRLLHVNIFKSNKITTQ